MKKIAICLLIMAALVFPVLSQESEQEAVEISLIESLSVLAEDAVSEISQNIRSGGALYTTGITFLNRPSQLGGLLNSVLLADIAGAELRNLSLYGEDADVPETPGSSVYTLSGEIYRLADDVYISLVLKKGADGEILMVSESVIPLTREVSMMLSGGMSGITSGGDSYEPNNDPTGAFPIDLNSQIDDLSLEPSGDVDWFFIEVPTAENTFISAGTTGSLDTVMDFYGPDSPDNLIVSNDDGDLGSNALIQTAVSEPGVYFISVTGYGSEERGSYGLFVNSEIYTAEEGEPNNSFSEAEYMPGLDLAVEKKLFPVGDTDWYRLDLSGFTFGSDDAVKVTTLSAMDTFMELYAGDVLMTSDDDGGLDGNAAVIFTPESGMEYRVMVRGYSESSIGDYTLFMDTVVLELDSYEPNNSREEATRIELNTTQEHTLVMSDVIDWYTFTLDGPDNINFETYGDMDTYVIMYDSQGNIIQESDDDGTGYNGRISMYLERGTYYCTVALYSSGSDVTEYSAGLSSN